MEGRRWNQDGPSDSERQARAALRRSLPPRPLPPPSAHWTTFTDAARGEPAVLLMRLVLETVQRIVLRLPDAGTDLLATARSLDGRANPALALVDLDGTPLRTTTTARTASTRACGSLTS